MVAISRFESTSAQVDARPVESAPAARAGRPIVGRVSARRNGPLPPHLKASGFSVSAAKRAGVGIGRPRGVDLAAPFHGVRMPAPPAPLEHQHRALAYAARMVPHAFFSHTTAAALYGAPLSRAAMNGAVHASVFAPRRAPSGTGVRGHQLARAFEPRALRGLRLAPPAQTWQQLAGVLPLDELIVVGDFFVTGTEPYDRARPLATLDELGRAVVAGAGSRGIRRAHAALREIRYGSLSPQETRLRLLIVRGGLPRPVLNYRVVTGYGYTEAMLDLAYPGLMVAIEYQGDQHRTSTAVYRSDVRRRERLVDLGWDVIYVSADDLRRRPLELLERIRSRLERASTSRKVL